MIMYTSTDEQPNSEGAGIVRKRRLIGRRRRGVTDYVDKEAREQLPRVVKRLNKMTAGSKRLAPSDSRGVMKRVKRVSSGY